MKAEKLLNKNIKTLDAIEKPIVTFSKKYCENIDFRTAIKILPLIGGYLDNLFAYKGSKIIQERVAKFFKETAEALKNLEEEKIDAKFLDSDEGFYIFQKIYERIIRSKEKAKVTLFRNIFINSIKVVNSGIYYKERFINIISELSIVHIEILKYYLERENVFKKENRGDSQAFTSVKAVEERLMKSNYQISASQIYSFCSDLLRYNLVYDRAALKGVRFSRDSYRITSSGIEFLNFILLDEI